MPKRQEPDIAPWEQQPGESAKAFEAFAIYRDMGVERSVRKVTQRLNKSLTLIGKWSSRYNWPERARAYDRDVYKRQRQNAIDKAESHRPLRANAAAARRPSAGHKRHNGQDAHLSLIHI